MDISNFLSEKSVIYSLKSQNKKQVVRELLALMADNGLVNDSDLAFSDIMSRENHLSTGMENGLAIPHAKTDAVKKLVVAFGVHRKGLDYDSLDGKPAHFIFLVLSPRDTSGPHIQALAQISRTLKNSDIRSEILQAQNAQHIFQLLTQSHKA
ncbi:MAG: PTS sugar transporter subunit IIA [Calditrichaeota bacterium]|nr:PTS sugar transporter subunit IIA [Calditrichota bacterium]